MGLFAKLLKKDRSEDTVQEKREVEIEFDNVTLETENILNTIKDVARSQKVNPSLLDFDILDYKTFYKDDTKSDAQWQELTKNNIVNLDKEKFFLNPSIYLKQIYNITIRKKEPKEHFTLDLTVAVNKLFTKVTVNIKKSDNIHYYSKLEQDLLDEINKKKVKAGIMLGVFEGSLSREVKKIVYKIKMDKMLKEDQSFLACEGFEPERSIDDRIIFHYKSKFKKEDENGRVDHTKKGVILPVNKGEVIIEYIKAKKGVNGRNCKGKFIRVKEPVERYKDMIEVTENIEVKEEEDRILYIAKKNGYVNQIKRGVYDIGDKMEVGVVNLKSTGSIEAGTDTDVKLHIKDKSVFNDAVGPGMQIESSHINIQGNVGSGAVLKANDLVIGGQTHQNSKIFTKTGKINVHRGKVEGKEILINRLEGGYVEADVVKISQAVGGHIKAKKIIVKQLMSNSKLSASKLIEIKELKGSDNKFFIDPTVERDFVQKRDDIKKEIERIKNLLKTLPQKGLQKQALIDKNRDTIESIKKKIAEYEALNRKPPATFTDKVEKFEKLKESYEKIQEQIRENRELLAQKEKELVDLQKSIFKARVVVHSPWTDFNEVTFRLITPPKNLTYYPDKGEDVKIVYLKPKDEEHKDFEIVKRRTL
ncbi:MAG: DUF342 domain-containing protein [Epsilonproteobacteria bacterium]|nr:DUF342 domain-containing protein [Campylobacterota bacterium]